MGLSHADVSLRNPRFPELRTVAVRARADTGALHLCIPEHVAIELRLETVDEREVMTADGLKRLCAYVGPIELRFGSRGCFTGALVLGDEVLLGSVPMEDLDLVISPATRSITVNPDSPDIASSTVKLERRRRRTKTPGPQMNTDDGERNARPQMNAEGDQLRPRYGANDCSNIELSRSPYHLLRHLVDAAKPADFMRHSGRCLFMPA